MPVPILTPTEIAALERQKAAQQNFADTLAAAIPLKQAKAAEYAVTDGAFKKFFDYYNDDIIGQYDAEYRALNGRYIPLPIVEADIVGPASIDPSSRTMPTLPQTDIVRIAQFDGGGTSTDPVNETQHIADQNSVENTLVNGYPAGGGFDPLTAVSDSSLSSGSTSLDVTDPTNPLTIAPGDYFVVSDGVNLAIVQVTTVTDNLGGDPPYEFTYGITVIIPPAAPIAAGGMLSEFTGFSDSERASKTASDPAQQPLMDLLVTQLQGYLNARIARLNQEIVALNLNEDPDAVAQIAATLVNVNASKTFLVNYLVLTDISDTGLALLDAETSTRSGQITARVAQIVANYTGQTENYYNRRYSIGNDRGNTQRGTLRLKIATTQSVGTLNDYSASAQDAADAIDAILP